MAAGLTGLDEEWARNAPRLLAALRGAGLWRATSLAHYFPTHPPEHSDIQDLLLELMPGVSEDDQDEYVPRMVEAVAAARRERRRLDYERATIPVWEIAAEDLRRKRERDAADYEQLFRRQHLAKVHRVPPPKPAAQRVGSIARDSRDLDGDPQGRAKGEQSQREKWIKHMTEYMSADGIDGTRPKLAAAGRRASTLRTRILAWRPFRTWMIRSNGTSRARGVDDYIDYLLLRADEPCSRSTLDGIVAMYTFVEGLCGRPRGSRWVDSQEFQSAVKEIRLGLSRRLDGNEVRKALRPTWRLLGGLEAMIFDESVSDYDRVLAWYMCTSSWCSFRFDDHRGWIPGSPIADPAGFTWDLLRTKTTGHGKAVELRPVGLSKEAYVAREGWFQIGMAVHARVSPGDRDYLLTTPPKGGDEYAIPRELSYEEYVPRMRAVLSKVSLGEDLVGKTLSEAFTAHSWRFFVPSAASALGYSQEQIDGMGTWSVKGGSGYNKTAKGRARQIQEHIARIGRSMSDKRDLFGEELDQGEVIRRLMGKGLDEQESRICSRRLVTGLSQGMGDSEHEQVDECTGALDATIKACTPASSSASGSQSAAARLPSEVTGYVVSLASRGKRRCLHYLGLCHRVPGIDYLNFIIHGEEAPSAEDYDTVCRKCWPQGISADDAPGAETEAEGGTTDQSDTPAE